MENIRILRSRMGLTQAELAQRLNVHQTAVSQWEKDRTKPDIDQMIRLAAFFDVSIECIADKAPIANIQRKTIRIPVYGNVAAGIPLEAITDIEDWEEIDEATAAKGEYIALRIHGRSMEPRILEGDIVIVRLQDFIEDGDIGIIFVNGDDATCKKIKKTPKGIMLISNNPAFEPMFYSNEEIENLPVRVLGKVVELRGKF